MCIAIVYFPVCDVKNSEIYLRGILLQDQKVRAKFKTSRTKIAFTDILLKTEGQYDIYFDGKITNRMGS